MSITASYITGYQTKRDYMKILHIDIETSPNTAHVWGLYQQNVSLSQLQDSSYTMCWAAKWHGKRKILFDSVYVSTPKKMLKKVWNLLDEADAVVHYNGAKFDIPTLNKEFLLNKMSPPSPYHQIDLLRVARKQFRFPSNKIDYVAKALGYGGKVKHIGHELWVRCMANDKKSWRDMERYNKQDVVLLEDVYNRLLPWIKDHPNHALYTGDTRPLCPNCGSIHVIRKGIETTKAMIYQRFKCQDCHTNIRGKVPDITKEKRRSLLTQSKT